MQTKRSINTRVRVTALALLAVAGLAGVAIAAARDDHAPPAHAAPSAAPAAEAKPKVAPKQLAPAHAEAASDAHGSAPSPKTEPVKTSAPKPAENTSEPSSPARSTPVASAGEPTGPLTADQALVLLNEGNQRWVSDKEKNPNATPQRREQTAAGQTPFATILTCADSRLPVERIFDRGVGDVFVIRVAGNVAGQSETGTIEYGVEHLKTPVLVVMGHTKCGAVAAAASGKPLHGALGGLVDHIRPAVDRAKNLNPNATPEQLAAAAVRENVWQTIYDLYTTSPELRSFASNGTVKVVGAIYDIGSGQVEWIGEHPWQREIIAALEASSGNTAVASSVHEQSPAAGATPNDKSDAHADAQDSHADH